MPLPIESFHARLPHGITLSCRAAGPADAPVIVFLHGFPEAAFIWDELMQHFAGRYRCIAPNLRGYADSSAPEGVEAYRATTVMRDIAALIEQQAPAAGSGAGRSPHLAALVAHDWGGAVAWTLAIQRPHLLPRLVMINSPHPATFLRDLQTDPAQQSASAYMNFLCRRDAAALLAEDDFARLWRLFTGMGGASAWLDEAMRERYRAVWRQGLQPALNYYRASPLRPPTDDDASVMDIRFEPAQVSTSVPTTVVWGEDDIALPIRLVEGLETWVPNLSVVRVAGASHWIVHEQPARVAAAIESALAG